jgi:hypothetical protein
MCDHCMYYVYSSNKIFLLYKPLIKTGRTPTYVPIAIYTFIAININLTEGFIWNHYGH